MNTSKGAGVERVLTRIGEIADHGDPCGCHPVELECCSRSGRHVRVDTRMVDALDTIRFAWHVGGRCRVRPDAHARVIPGTRVWWIGSAGWWMRSLRVLPRVAEGP